MIRFSSALCISGCALAAALLVPLQSAAKGFHVVYTFQSTTDGYESHAGVINDSAGNLYGTTFYGGDTNLQQGTVFKLTPDGTKTTLYNFTGGTDGALPAGLTMDSAGNLYGTTLQGGVVGGCSGHGCGVVYRIAPDGTETVLYTFTGAGDGGLPQGTLIFDRKSNLYGTTTEGGTSRDGTVFKFSARGKETALHSFAGGRDGQSPTSGLIADKAGNMFGTTNLGGSKNDCNGFGKFGCGTVYRIAADGSETVLHAFTGGSDGGLPFGGMLIDKSGNLYGTTEFGGVAGGCGGYGCGTVFKLAPDGTLTTLYTFTGGSDGGQPVASLVGDGAGNLYGTTLFWGQGYGVVFALAPNGVETILHSFTGGDDGAYPWGALLKQGHNYDSTAASGGSEDFGTVFKLRK